MASSAKTNNKPGSAERPVPHTRIENETMFEEKYEFGRKLGQGSFGVVYEVKNKATAKRWACKAIYKEKAGSSAIKLLEREVAILKRVDHEHLIHLEEVFETSKRMYLIIEFCEGGELAKLLEKKGRFSETETKTIMAKLSSAVSYLHKHDIVHRDIKLENILLSQNPQDASDHLHIKVTDFGLSVVKGGVSHDNMMQAFCGTPMYMAPEIIDNKTYSHQCDVWAMGVIMYILLRGEPPFKAKDEDRLYEIIKQGVTEQMVSGNPWDSISDSAKNCIKSMLHVNPAHRCTASEVVDGPWITGKGERQLNVLELMRQMKAEENAVNGQSPADECVDGQTDNNNESKPKENGAQSQSSSRNNSGNANRKNRVSVASRRSSAELISKSSSNSNLKSMGPSPRSKNSLTPPQRSSASSKSKSPTSSSRSPVSSGPSSAATSSHRSNTSNAATTRKVTPTTPTGTAHHAARTTATKTYVNTANKVRKK